MSNLPYCRLAVCCVVEAKVWIPIRRAALIEGTLSGICVPGTTSEARTFAGLSAMSCGNLPIKPKRLGMRALAPSEENRQIGQDHSNVQSLSLPFICYLLPVTSRMSL
jgi:hypothetical protein